MSMEELLEAEVASVREVRRGSVVEGTIVRIDQDEVLVDIGLKSEGVVPVREMSAIEADMGRPAEVGDTLLVYVVAPEAAEGHAILSYRRAENERFWRRAQDQVQSG
jgi:small subunit ribosomal protein S1